jgi:hypothetical protein
MTRVRGIFDRVPLFGVAMLHWLVENKHKSQSYAKMICQVKIAIRSVFSILAVYLVALY